MRKSRGIFSAEWKKKKVNCCCLPLRSTYVTLLLVGWIAWQSRTSFRPSVRRSFSPTLLGRLAVLGQRRKSASAASSPSEEAVMVALTTDSHNTGQQGSSASSFCFAGSSSTFKSFASLSLCHLLSLPHAINKIIGCEWSYEMEPRCAPLIRLLLPCLSFYFPHVKTIMIRM